MYRFGEKIKYIGNKYNDAIPKGTEGCIVEILFLEQNHEIYYVMFKNNMQLWCEENEIESIVERKKQMNENYLMLNGKRVDLTNEQIEKLGLKVEQEDCFKRSYCSHETYYYINSVGNVLEDKEIFDPVVDDIRYKVANYCTDKSLLQQRALHETLSRLLWRFSMQNDGDKIDWSNSSKKYYICYNYSIKNFIIEWLPHDKEQDVYFHTKEIAQRAIDEIIIPFMKEYPEFIW